MTPAIAQRPMPDKRRPLHTYRVGMLSDVRQVQAPSPLAAATLYGIHAVGHSGSYAEVFEEDEKPWRGEATWRRWAMGDEPTEAQIEQLKRELPFTRFLRPALGQAA